jgi:hypothetical protein
MAISARTWFVVRLLFVGFWAFSGITSSFPALPASQLMGPIVFALVAGATGARFWVFREYKKRNRTQPWLLPSWFVNPFQTRQPFQFFHLGGISFIVFGVTAAIRHAIVVGDPHAWPGELFGAAFGLGILGGIWLTTNTYKNRFVSSKNSHA